MSIQSHYLKPVLTPDSLKETIKRICDRLKEHKKKFDTIVFRGMSGALVAPMVAAKLNKQMLMIRKKDGSHSIYSIEGNVGLKNYIIVDDLVCTGDTVNQMVSSINKEVSTEAKFVGISLYLCAMLKDEKDNEVRKNSLKKCIETKEDYFVVFAGPDMD